jgi:hypothetical protein
MSNKQTDLNSRKALHSANNTQAQSRVKRKEVNKDNFEFINCPNLKKKLNLGDKYK